MKASLFRQAAAFLLLAFFVPAFVRADDATAKCMMWKVSSDTATVYLVGSMHFAKPEMYPLPKEMEEAFAKSDTLVVEVNIDKLDQSKVLAIVQEKGMYKGNELLSTSIKKEVYTQLTDVCQTLGLPVLAIDKMKPWLVGVTIEEMEVQKLGLDPNIGIDKHFLGLAEKKGEPIEELESMEFQLGLLAGFDAKAQEEGLAAALEGTKGMKEDLDKMTAAWIAGDGKGLMDVVTEKQEKYPATKEVMQKVIYDRNGPMAEKVEAYLKGKKTVFVIAGCAHMVGEKGIVELLKKDKFKVEQSSATKADK